MNVNERQIRLETMGQVLTAAVDSLKNPNPKTIATIRTANYFPPELSSRPMAYGEGCVLRPTPTRFDIYLGRYVTNTDTVPLTQLTKGIMAIMHEGIGHTTQYLCDEKSEKSMTHKMRLGANRHNHNLYDTNYAHDPTEIDAVMTSIVETQRLLRTPEMHELLKISNTEIDESILDVCRRQPYDQFLPTVPDTIEKTLSQLETAYHDTITSQLRLPYDNATYQSRIANVMAQATNPSTTPGNMPIIDMLEFYLHAATTVPDFVLEKLTNGNSLEQSRMIFAIDTAFDPTVTTIFPKLSTDDILPDIPNGIQDIAKSIPDEARIFAIGTPPPATQRYRYAIQSMRNTITNAINGHTFAIVSDITPIKTQPTWPERLTQDGPCMPRDRQP